MSATNKDRAEFIAVLREEFPDKPADDVARIARALLRHAWVYQSMQVDECNGYPIDERAEKLLEKQIVRRCTELGISSVRFGGDPRGFTVKLFLPSGRYNSWGGKECGWGVPT